MVERRYPRCFLTGGLTSCRADNNAEYVCCSAAIEQAVAGAVQFVYAHLHGFWAVHKRLNDYIHAVRRVNAANRFAVKGGGKLPLVFWVFVMR